MRCIVCQRCQALDFLLPIAAHDPEWRRYNRVAVRAFRGALCPQSWVQSLSITLDSECHVKACGRLVLASQKVQVMPCMGIHLHCYNVQPQWIKVEMMLLFAAKIMNVLIKLYTNMCNDNKCITLVFWLHAHCIQMHFKSFVGMMILIFWSQVDWWDGAFWV